jgi:3',5'-cyclic AMP phosphodiesterase CpdA
MEQTEFPLVIGPNLGCPHIVSVEDLKAGKTISLIVAGQYGEFSSPSKDAFKNVLFLRSSYGDGVENQRIPLDPVHDPEEITAWNVLCGFSDLENTRELIISELHYNVLGENTRYWKLDVSVKIDGDDYKGLLKERDGKHLPRLYDLILKDEEGKCERVNYHSVQFVDSVRGECNLIHLTDPHVATRNDEILGEVLKTRNRRPRSEIIRFYVNFNKNLREFIKKANEMYEAGKLDFVVITGDLVDFAFHGWDDESNPDENNWKTFINICTGAGKETSNGNPGFKVAVYTSTGNHDWRLHPYSPTTGHQNESFGLRKEELKNYNYKSFDSEEYPEDERAKLSRKITGKAFKKLNLDAFADSGKVKLAKFLSGRISRWILMAIIRVDVSGTGDDSGKATKSISSTIVKWILPVMGGAGVSGAGLKGYLSNLTFNEYRILAFLGVLVGVLIWFAKSFLERWVRKYVDFIIDNPLHAEASALHYYLKHINPYLDYAFRFGDHSFVVMDTGSDVFTGRLLDNKTFNDIKKMSVQDNILGGSPDSRAFDSEQSYYNWSQIVWLEKILACIRDKGNDEGSMMVFLHAPPINPAEGSGFRLDSLWERNREEPKWIPKSECNLTYGSINHYLSQFFHLCMGFKENELSVSSAAGSVKKVDLVFSGHTHRNVEFRIGMRFDIEGNGSNVTIYSDVYSELLDTNNPDEWWEKHMPVIVQTAACGSAGGIDNEPPYFRKVLINGNGKITDFQVRNLNGVIFSKVERNE